MAKFLDALLDNPVSRVVRKLPGQELGESVVKAGTNIYNLASGGRAKYEANLPQNTVNVPRLIGDTVSAAATPVAFAVPGAGIVRTAAAQGALGGVITGGRSLSQGNTAPVATRDAIRGAATSAALVGGLGVAGKAAQKLGGGIYKLAVPMSAREAQMVQNYRATTPFLTRATGRVAPPRTAEVTALDKGLVGTESMVGTQANRAARRLWDGTIGKALQQSQEKVKMTSFFDDAASAIRADNPEPTRQRALLEALEAVKEDYAQIGNVPLTDLQKFKEGWAQFVPEKAYKGQPIAGNLRQVQDTLADLARKRIYASLGTGVRNAYIDYGNLQDIAEAGQRAMTGGKLRGGTGGFVSGIKDMLLTPAVTTAGLGIRAAGTAAQGVGSRIAPFVSEPTQDLSAPTTMPTSQITPNTATSVPQDGFMSDQATNAPASSESPSMSPSVAPIGANGKPAIPITREEYERRFGKPAPVSRGNLGTGETRVSKGTVVSSINIPPTARLAKVNNNPGNLKFVGQTGATRGEKGFARFRSPQEGFNALIRQVRLDQSRGFSLARFIGKFAPPSENNTKQYIQQLAKRLRVNPNTPINRIDSLVLAKEIARKESSTVVA